MAVRQQHIHDGGIVERRLRPIYDWLDNGNNKKALQEAEKVLKKSPTLQAARALKALALFRLGKAQEAHPVLDALADEKPSDEVTLQAMTISYRETQQLQKVCALYEAAIKAEPASEELHSHLFMSYVRVGDYHSQQRAAMALYKFAPKNPYYFWAVMSIVLQAKSTDDSVKKGILLALAQRMVDNFITDNKMEAEQEARLYIMILELQSKWQDILKFIEGPLYPKLVPGNVAQASIPYLKNLEQWKRLNLICQELLYDNQDRWDYYTPYFDSAFQLMKDSDISNSNDFHNTSEHCHEFICQLLESMEGRHLRGPYLARLELWKRLAVDGDPTSILGSGVALCIQYLRVFGHKPCAVPDLRQYIAMLPQQEREEHSHEFLTCLGLDENSLPETQDDIQKHLSSMSAWFLTAAPFTAELSLSLATKLRDHYFRCLDLGLANSTPTEFCTADGYGILAAHQYFNAARELKSSVPIVEALCLLELVLHHSPANFHIKVLLVQLYHLIGNALAADTIYQKLEVKHIQLVTLSWLHGSRLAPGCAASRALQLLADTRAFHSHRAKDSVEHLTYAYKYGTFEKLVELYAWNARIDACGTCAIVARERALLSLAAGPPAPLHTPSRLPDQPSDNRDLDVILNWEPPQFLDPDFKRRTFDEEMSYLKLKDALVSSIALCIELSDGRSLIEKRPHYEELNTCIEAFSSAMDICKEKYCAREKISISKPFPSRIIAFVNSPVPYRELYSLTLKMVGQLAVGEINSAHSICVLVAELVRESVASLKHSLPTTGDAIWQLRYTLEALSNFLEFTGVITYLLGVCNELLAPANAKKSRKKTNQSPVDVKTHALLGKLNESVQNAIVSFEDIFDHLPLYTYQPTLDQVFSKLNIDNKYQSPVEQKLKNGQEEMVNDIKNILKKKHKYLKSLLLQ